MAKVKLNPVMEQMRGKVGDLVFKRFQDEVVIARKPGRSGRAPTPGQAAHRQRFRLAALYGKAVFADPIQRALYADAAKTRRKSAFALTVSDYLNAPAVDDIDLSAYAGNAGDLIAIRASDDFGVAGVTVVIRDAAGAVLEQGAAVNDRGAWRYTASATVPPGQAVVVEVTATDRPGNKTVKSQAKP